VAKYSVEKGGARLNMGLVVCEWVQSQNYTTIDKLPQVYPIHPDLSCAI
jgi:hypothetical protein